MIEIPENTPTDMIVQYRQQGYDDDSIIKSLQQQGFDSQQIFDAFNQADLKSQAIASPVQGMEEQSSGGNNEQMIEAMITEKWKEFQAKIDSLTEWKEEFESKVLKVEDEIRHIKENYDRLHQGVLGKISEYDSNLKDVGSSVKAMDQVFKQVLPSLTENVNRLSRMTGQVRRVPPRPPQ